MSVDIRPLENIGQLSILATLADAEGHEIVSRLVEDWRRGENRFDRSGEALLIALGPADIVGVCGLNRDPFVAEGQVGRLRRLYVAPAWRRQGIASALVSELLIRAVSWFDVVHVRTYNRSAVAFYRSLGFVEVKGDPTCTHRRDVAA